MYAMYRDNHFLQQANLKRFNSTVNIDALIHILLHLVEGINVI